MAVNGKAWLHGSATHPTRVPRNANAAHMGQPWGTHANSATATTRGGSYGVVGDGDLLVTTTGSLGYSIAPGRVVAPGTFAAAQGGYTGYNDAAVTGTFTARHATLSRTDYVCYRVRDTDEDATTFEDDALVVIDGTAGAGAPAVPSSLGTLVILSEVTVPSAAAGTALTFTDRRTKAVALGGRVVCTSGTRPTGIALRTPTYIYETDTACELTWNGSAWRYTLRPRTAVSPGVSTFITSLGAGTSVGWWIQTGDIVTFQGRITLGAGTTFSASPLAIDVALPTPAATTVDHFGDARLLDVSANRFYPASAQVQAGLGALRILNASITTTYNFTATDPFTWNGADGDLIDYHIQYAVA